MTKNYLQIALISFLTASSSWIIYQEIKDIKFNIDGWILLLIFLVSTILLDKFASDKRDSIENVLFINFSFALIILANPVIVVIYSICYGCFRYFKLKYAQKHIIIFEACRNFIVTYSSFYIIKTFFPEVLNSFTLTPTLLLAVASSLSMGIIVEYLIKALYNFKQLDISYAGGKFILNRILQSILTSLFMSPLLIHIYQSSSYSGLIFPIGLIFVLSFTMKKNIEKQQELEEFREKSYRDGLTGIYNRRYLDEYIEELNAIEEPVAVIMLDIDKFKSVNDNYNHGVGDQVLKHFSLILQKCIRNNDTLIRYGGEEFAIFLTKLTPEQAKIAAERIRASVEASFAIVNFNNQSVNLKYTTSLGLFYAHTHRGFHLKTALKEADNLLYLSKHGGRNRVTANI